jgi:hypothetical protein
VAARILADIQARIEAGEAGPDWDEVMEQRIAHIATNWDETTRTYQPPLRNPRRTR